MNDTNRKYTPHPREKALGVLTAVLSGGRPLDSVLDATFAEDATHRAWMQDVCSGVLRWKGRLDLAIDSIALRKKPTGRLRKALQLAAYQLIAQDDVPAHVVVNETVEYVTAREGKGPAGFANVVLRRLSEHAAKWKALEYSPKASAEEKANWASLPVWMWNLMAKSYGSDWAARYAVASLERPTLWVHALKDWPGADASAVSVEAGPLKGSYRVLDSSRPVPEWPGFEAGQFFVQDISNQWLVERVSQVLLDQGARKVLDLCAAPGGKTIGLAWNGFDVTATDIDSTRLKAVRENVERLKLGASVQVVEKKDLGTRQWDGVWIDAPCTGTGILRRHPDVRWLKQSEQLEGLNRIQRELLLEGWEKVAPGGVVAYTVCSVLAEEGRDLVKSVSLPGATTLEEKQLSPLESPFGDGFYFVLLRKA